MNLRPFIQLVTGESPERAFDIGTHAAKLAFGNGGFTGTLADKGRQCIACGACDGALKPSAASVVVIVHGPKAKQFERAHA